MQEELSQTIPIDDFVGVEESQFLTFQLNKDIYGINILRVKEIIDFGNITKVPMMPNFIAGVINLRGSVVPVIDLALRFSQTPSIITKRSSIVIVEIPDDNGRMEIGITVDEVNEVLEILPSEIELAPSFGTKIRTDFISGMGKIQKELLILLDLEKILAIEELSAV